MTIRYAWCKAADLNFNFILVAAMTDQFNFQLICLLISGVCSGHWLTVLKKSASKLSNNKIWRCKTQEEHQDTYNDSASGLHCRKNPTLLTFSWLEYLGIHIIRLQQNRQIRQQPTIYVMIGAFVTFGEPSL